MNYLSFFPLYVAKLIINNAYALFKTTIELSTPVKSELGPVVNAALTKFTADNEKFGLQINKNHKSELTDVLQPIDKERENVHGEIKGIVRAYSKSSDNTKKSASKTMKIFLDPYRKIATLPLNTQTGIISELLAKYKSRPDLISAAQILSVDQLFVMLEAKNNAFDTLYKNRNEEYSMRETSGSSLKPAAVASYVLFCSALEQAVNLTPNDAILALFYKLDELRKKYHALGGNDKDNSGKIEDPTK